jgi:hypothetical protein
VSHAGKQEKSLADAPGDPVANPNFGAGNALKQYSQRLLDRY